METSKRTNDVIRVRFPDRETVLSWSKGFAVTHQLLVRKRYEEASRMAAVLHRLHPDRRDAILLEARCASAKKDYEASHWLTQRALEGTQDEMIQPVHAAFTFRSVGLLEDARKEIREILREKPEFASGWLFYGDVLADLKKPSLARSCWRKAMRQDSSRDGVYTAAKERIRELQRRQQ